MKKAKVKHICERWRAALRRTPVTVWNEDVTDWAAALTYYAVLALFPLLLVILSILGLTMPTAKPEVIDRMTQAAPAASRELLRGTLRQMAEQSSTAWTLIFVAGTGALWSGCSYLSVFRRAIYSMHRVDADRPVWRTAPRIIGTALVLITLFLTSTLALLLTGNLTRRLGRALDLGTSTQFAWNAVRWPVIAVVAVALVLVLYRSGPARTRPVHRMAPGGALAVVLLLAVSVGFAVYTAHVSTYDRLYGSLAGIVVFLVWLWLSNLALLVGAQFNAELAKPVRGE
ncbi:YihY/virulence factor BrkB family protein [Streptomyces sp. WI04-05B]|uniref:YihY/virulence factor BrkB family protein n=1 Tax=Streptomyces TaxID=1883 RepID=UPI0029A9512F|nr:MULTISPECIES: YihY/virulence factor BrkB family protein [unclassified Streptomyces]MDX2546391.1 YihY/virulence factor BrkB family protein [Streptomyces sp. WI04-05B]MDX2586248.1 YihY/virulence factor BrkB family protein [Streptomyces sp. WI04-05A]MDX3748898.1 YihY/virulence factor BrkB family protein [Streptomyces sp. AK08-02]